MLKVRRILEQKNQRVSPFGSTFGRLPDPPGARDGDVSDEAEVEPKPLPPVARVSAARAEVEAKLTSPASSPIVRNVLGNAAVVCVSFYDAATQRARHVIVAREGGDCPWTSSVVRGRFETLDELVQQLGVQRLAPSPSSSPLSQPARRLTRLQMAGGKDGGLKEARYESPCGVIVTASREPWSNKDYYFIRYMFDEHVQKTSSGADAPLPTPSIHRTYWLPNQRAVLKGWLSFDFPASDVGIRELRTATACVSNRSRGARQVTVQATYGGLTEPVTLPPIDTSEDTIGSPLRIIPLPFPNRPLKKLTLQLQTASMAPLKQYGPGVRSIELWRE